MNKFVKVDDNKLKTLEGGLAISSVIAAITSLVPAGISLISSIIGTVKATTAPKGEIKTKDQTYKWDNSETTTYNVGFSYCI